MDVTGRTAQAQIRGKSTGPQQRKKRFSVSPVTKRHVATVAFNGKPATEKNVVCGGARAMFECGARANPPHPASTRRADSPAHSAGRHALKWA